MPGCAKRFTRRPFIPGDVNDLPARVPIFPRARLFPAEPENLRRLHAAAEPAPARFLWHRHPASRAARIWPSPTTPTLKPERTESYDVGIEQRFLNNQLSLDATYFHNDYRDLIVSLGGSLSTLSQYYTDNLAKANAKGVEASAKFRPATWISVTGNYTWLETEVLSLNGGIGLVQQYFYLGQPLLRQPKQSGSALVNFHYGKVDANLMGYFRGRDLDVEPNYGASGGLLLEPRICERRDQCELPGARQSDAVREPPQRARPALRRDLRISRRRC